MYRMRINKEYIGAKIMVLKEWSCEIEVHFTHHGIEAKSKEDFIESIKDIYKEEYNLDLKDHEIKNIQEITND